MFVLLIFVQFITLLFFLIVDFIGILFIINLLLKQLELVLVFTLNRYYLFCNVKIESDVYDVGHCELIYLDGIAKNLIAQFLNIILIELILTVRVS